MPDKKNTSGTSAGEIKEDIEEPNPTGVFMWISDF